jgi:nucleotide-binding universal stress UspA family protein
MGYTSIVVGTDGSPTAQKAVAQAAELAAADAARLVIVTAYQSAAGGKLAGEVGEFIASHARI